MSVFGLERSHTSPADIYDHPIGLIDTTKPQVEAETAEEPPDAKQASVSGQTVGRHSTKGHLRKELARRKYAKWQEEKEPTASVTEASGEDSGPEAAAKKSSKSDPNRSRRLRDKVPFRGKKAARGYEEHETFIDVLYENQRGWFLCGIPLYSSNSLLNFDPAGWQNSTFHDSPVNITNAQLPDPTWHWEWRTWYVDMSDDVDEEGWQYSFSFGNQFAWHGSHPWFHSFVRRRRWLRKRVKNDVHQGRGRRNKMHEAHLLTADYFTIHAAARDRSRGSSADRSTNNRSSFLGTYSAADDSEDDMGEIGDVTALMGALKRSIVDREKMVAVKIFLAQGGDELFYLAEAMPVILGDFVHQTSKRQLQQTLLRALDESIKEKDNADQKYEEDRNVVTRRIDNLLKAIHAAGVHTNDIEYWSTLRSRATGSEADPTNETHALDADEEAEPLKDATNIPSSTEADQSVKDEIKGISGEAQISEEPHIGFTKSNEEEDSEGRESKILEKGKGRA